MKKLLIAIVMLCYLVVSSGVVVNFHYCMNKLASAQLFSPQQKKCGKCGMHMNQAHGCCRDEVSIVKMEDDQKQATWIAYDFSLASTPVLIPSEYIQTAFQNTPADQLFLDHPPPLISESDTYLQISVFRI